MKKLAIALAVLSTTALGVAYFNQGLVEPLVRAMCDLWVCYFVLLVLVKAIASSKVKS